MTKETSILETIYFGTSCRGFIEGKSESLNTQQYFAEDPGAGSLEVELVPLSLAQVRPFSSFCCYIGVSVDPEGFCIAKCQQNGLSL